ARGCDNTREHVEFYYAEDIQHDPKFDLMLKNNAERWRTVFLEDVSVVEGMQKGRQGTMFDGGAFSPVLDNGTHCFHQWVASQMVKNGKQSLDVD
ncbi:MAG: RHO alpha subunit C-terminal catalytic domain-containing protein, partial [Kangiellaceae bacterium]